MSGRHPNERNAFISPTVAAKVRLGNRISPRNSDSGSATSSRRSRKPPSPEDAEILQQLSGSTAVSLSHSDSKRRRGNHNDTIMTQMSNGAMQLVQSFSPTSQEGESHDATTPDNGRSQSMEPEDEIPTNLDLGHNDNSFHVLASLLVEFFQDRYTSSTIVLLPEDRFALDRLLPSTAVHPLIEAVQYRLGHTPAVPTTPIQFLTLECQKLGLDRTDPHRNPILVAATLHDEPVTIPVLAVDDKGRVLLSTEQDDVDEYVMDVQQGSSSSSSQSVIHVASSQEVADEMQREAYDGHAILDRVELQEQQQQLVEPPVLLSDDDSFPTEHDDVVVEEEGDESPAVVQKSNGPMQDPSIGVVHDDMRALEEMPNRFGQPPASDENGQEAVLPATDKSNAPVRSPDGPPAQRETKTTAVPQSSQPTTNKSPARAVQSQPATQTQPTSQPAVPPESGFMEQFQATAGNFFQDFFTNPSSAPVVTKSSIPPTEDTTVQNSSVAVANPSTKDTPTVAQSTNTNRAVVAEKDGEAVISPVVPANPNPPINPFLMNFASFMDRNAAPPRPPIRNDSFATATSRSTTSYSPPRPNQPVVRNLLHDSAPLLPPPHPKDTTKTRSNVELQPLPAKPTIRSDQTAREQLEDELAEAEQMLNMSVTSETKNFWKNHRDLLASRLATLVDGPTTVLSSQDSTPIAPVPSTGSANNNNNYLSGSTLPDAIQAGSDEVNQGSRTFSEMTPTPPTESGNMQQPNHLTTTGTLPMVDVVAPADLPGGYQFEAEIEGKRFLAVVPSGGVQQGETFTCYMRELDSVAVDIPVGHWKDGLADMCRFGCCHPVFWHSFMCPLIALGQIQTRIDLDFLGRPRFGTTSASNRFMMLTLVFFWVFTNIGLFIACNLKWSHGMELTVADICAFLLMNGTMLAFLVFVTQSTRNSLREKFMIREERCLDLEDLCCALACLPCTVGQMARHTANYEEYEAVCCSHTGLPDGVSVNQSEEPPTEYKKDGYVV